MVKPRHPRLLALAFYVLLGLLTAGWYAISDPTGVCACEASPDLAAYTWSLGWWPHALAHGLNPFFSTYVWTPAGANLARSATIPTASLALAPVTALFGLLVSYNVVSVASPVLAAFTAYLLCRRVTHRELPALAGGYLFGFGPYQFAQLTSHPNLSLVFLVPVIFYLALRRAERDIQARTYIVALAIVLALQVGLSTEVLSTTVAFGLLLLAAARLLAPHPYRGRIGSLLAETVAGGTLAALLTSPFLYYALFKGGLQHEVPYISDNYALDLLNPFVPTHTTWLGGSGLKALSAKFVEGNNAEADGYVSLAIVFAFVLFAVRSRRRFLARMLIIVVAVSFFAALGSHLHVAGEQSIPLPYDWLRNLPVVRLITPARIVMYGSLAMAVGVAAWLSERSARSLRGALRWLLLGVGAMMVFPNVSSGLWGNAPANPQFFRGTAYRNYLTEGETALVLPFAADTDSELWQAETGFYFRMPEGYLGHFAPPQFEGQLIVSELAGNQGTNPTLLKEFLNAYHVRDIVVEATARAEAPYEAELERLGLHGVRVDGVLVYHVPPNGL
ncbi:MAG: hypothetical protein ACYDA6_06570 [Solirubrobacteraceae bacterium]